MRTTRHLKTIALSLVAIVLPAGVAAAYASTSEQRVAPRSTASEPVVLMADTCRMAPSYWPILAQKKALMDQLVSQYALLNQIIAIEQANDVSGILNRVISAQIKLRDEVAQRKNLAINDYSQYLSLQVRCI
jgi:hypothetical protein